MLESLMYIHRMQISVVNCVKSELGLSYDNKEP